MLAHVGKYQSFILILFLFLVEEFMHREDYASELCLFHYFGKEKLPYIY
jgi:hypothetical protein